MTGGDFLLWLAWAAFGTVLMGVVVTRYVLPIFRERLPVAADGLPAGSPPRGDAWLFVEDGAPMDKRAAWFRVRVGGETVLGNTPRSAVGNTTFVFLNAHDIRDRQVTIRWDSGQGRFVLQKAEGMVRHNNESLPDGATVTLTDGDTLDIEEITRMRFTYTGPSRSPGMASE